MTLRRTALAVALPVAAVGALALFTDITDHWLSPGAIQKGHREIACVGCHVPSPGTTRQQLQAKVAYAAGWRADNADFGRAAVTSEVCLDCHARPNDRHPVYRFREPRFIDALQVVEADSCLGCHSEHHDARVAAEPEFCRACHGDLKMANDPLDVAHEALVAERQWGTCLGCHDFHGNHARKPPLLLEARVGADAVAFYFGNGVDPYGDEKLFEAKTE